MSNPQKRLFGRSNSVGSSNVPSQQRQQQHSHDVHAGAAGFVPPPPSAHNVPTVPRINRRSNSSSLLGSHHATDDDALAMADARQRSAVACAPSSSVLADEFGFPVNPPAQNNTQQQNSKGQQRPIQQQRSIQQNVQHMTHEIDLDKIDTPSRFQQQRRHNHPQSKQKQPQLQTQSQKQQQNNNIMQQQILMQQQELRRVPSHTSATATNPTTTSFKTPAKQIPQQHQHQQPQLVRSTSSNISRNSSTFHSSSINNMATPSRPPRSQQPSSAYSRQTSHRSTSSTASSSARHSSSKSSIKPTRSKSSQPKMKISKPDPKRYQNYTFQHPANAMRVSVRSVDLSNRRAFDTRLGGGIGSGDKGSGGIISSSSLKKLLSEMERVRSGTRGIGISGSSSVISSAHSSGGGGKKRSENPCRISPSPNHLAILEFMHGSSSSALKSANGKKVVRQLQWNVATSVDADPWFDGLCDQDDYKSTHQEDGEGNTSLDVDNVNSNIPLQKKNYPCRKPSKSPHGDGRYIPINPLSAIKSTLPNHSPLLTNVKRRLPMRADVGFSNPTEEEIALKMAECKKESDWEEASPRIILMASGFPLGGWGNENDASEQGTNYNNNGDNEKSSTVDELHPSCRSDVKLWAGGSVPGVPFAGRDLVMAYKMTCKWYHQNEKTSEDGNSHDADPNPGAYSVFAPPVDATFSSSHLWRPRPFMDRPPGFVYFLACPLDVRFVDVGDIEPLFCTMTLYSLSKSLLTSEGDYGTGGTSIGNFRGKISEDFFFPAGDWNGIDDETMNNEIEEDEQQAWRRRKRRAIMTYDPLDVSMQSLYIVIQVYKVAQPNGCVDYFDSTNTGGGIESEASSHLRKKSIGSKIKRSLLSKGKSKDDTSSHQMQPSQSGNAQACSRDLLEGGAQFLTPLCFSIVPAFPSDNSPEKQKWPAGETMRAPFYSFHDKPESQEEFVERLVSLSECQTSKKLPNSDNIRSYMHRCTTSQQSSSKTGSTTIAGYVDIFSSFLGGDFTRALLDDPLELCDRASDTASLGPQLLADVMGDCAIGFDGTSGDIKKRSKLRRLPPTQDSGYADFDLKEVLYFPPRSIPRKHDDDVALCSSTVLNLLYVYPRLIRNISGGSRGFSHTNQHVSLRIRIVEQELSHEQSFDSAECVYEPMHAIFNPLSAGPPLIEAFFTKLIDTSCHNANDYGSNASHKTKGNKNDIPLKDEVKIRLPDVLDRRHFIQFALLSVNIPSGSDTCVENTVIAETTVPLIISSKEPTSGGRVTTVIPNGLHRIQLSEEFQVHIETRLASSLHISDPSVATLLRDSPFLSDVPDSNIIVHGPSGVPFYDILSNCSVQGVKRHFLSLMTLSMMNFVNERCPPFYFESLFDVFGSGTEWHRLVAWEKTDSQLTTLRSLFDILDKTRTSYLEKEHSMISLHYYRLLKTFLDSFDDLIFLRHSSGSELLDPENGDDSLDNSAWTDGAYFEEVNSADAPLSATKASFEDQRTNSSKYRFASPKNSGIGVAPFSRKAFVATRMEQMKAEAEMYDDDLYTNDYFDDDETVMTFGTMASRMDSGSVFSINLETKSSNIGHDGGISVDNASPRFKHSDSANHDTTSHETPPPNGHSSRSSSDPFSFASTPAKYMANRVNNVAQLMIAPCMAPSLSEVISCGAIASPRNAINLSSTDGRMRGGNNFPSTRFASIKVFFEPSSDVEEEGEKNNPSVDSATQPKLRGIQSYLSSPQLVFCPMTTSSSSNMDNENATESNKPYLYESIFALWVQAWTVFASSLNKSEKRVKGTSNAIPAWPYELVQGINNPKACAIEAFSFVRHTAFFLPLCLKSLALRCSNNYTTKLIVPMTFLDDCHMQILVPLVETIALGTMREAMRGSSGVSNSDQMLTKALLSSDHILDFIIGLFALLHPSQVVSLILAYFNILQECECPIETKHNHSANKPDNANLRRLRCARQIRLHGVERLGAMPRFASLNFPLKYTGSYPKHQSQTATMNWSSQIPTVLPVDTEIQAIIEKVDRYPQSSWLAELLMDECLDICHRSCEAIIFEAQSQAKAVRRGRKAENHNALSRGDLLRIESMAVHAIMCAHELLVKRHAMDSRYQSIACNTRIAGMFVSSVLEHSVNAISSFAMMDASHKVRCTWLLCVLYILQEGPEVLIRNKLRDFCRTEDNRINDFVCLLKLAAVTFQYLIPGCGTNESLQVIGGMSKEITQETFNCLSASIILLIDECFDVVSAHDFELERLAKSIFDLLLHILTTPQSSVTLLRTLGGSAHALDKFGASVFLNAVGDRFQHWARIVFSLMNSTELSVRSMAVDFFVSLIGDAHSDCGNVDDVILCILTVLPEVVAREIALCSASGLIMTMEDAETSLWPLRRALADVEDTNPLDDERIDPQLLPSIRTLCRTGQAIIDGVLIEMRLKCSDSVDLDMITKAQQNASITSKLCSSCITPSTIFDADEESLLEAANFFSPETSLHQRLRWLFTLRDLHIMKEQWTEVAETLILCARALIEACGRLAHVWKPSRFDLWNDYRHSPWLSSIGLSHGRGNVAVMNYAKSFLEPAFGMPRHATVEDVCSLTVSVLDQALSAYTKEYGLEDIAYAHLEELLCIVSDMIHNENQKHRSELVSALRRVRSNICLQLTKLTEQDASRRSITCSTEGAVLTGTQRYVRVILHGKNKPDRFKESTTIPTFFEWDIASICRVSKQSLVRAAEIMRQSPIKSEEECICAAFAEPFIKALKQNNGHGPIVLRTREFSDESRDDANTTFIDVMLVQVKGLSRFVGRKGGFKSRKFFLRNHGPDAFTFDKSLGQKAGITEFTVASKFPHSTSRQRSLITSTLIENAKPA